MKMPGFKGRVLPSATKPRTVGEALNQKNVCIDTLPSSVYGKLYDYLSDNFSGCDAVTKVYDTQDGRIVGSNIFATVATNEFLKKYGMEVATIAQIEKDIRNGNATCYRRRYHDLGLVLRSIEEPNVYHARKVAEQLPADLQLPAKLDIRDLKIEIDQKAPEGVSFVVTKPERAIYVSQFSQKMSFDDTDKNGLPIKKSNMCCGVEAYDEESRQTFVLNSGLFGLCLGRQLDLRWNDLAYSDLDGRVKIVTKEE